MVASCSAGTRAAFRGPPGLLPVCLALVVAVALGSELRNVRNVPGLPGAGLTATCPLPPSWTSGGKIVYTTELIDGLVNKVIAPELVASLMEIVIPDIDGTTKTSTGTIEYHIGDIAVTEATLLEAEFSSDSTSQLLVELIDFGMALQFSYKYQKTSFPYTGDEGSGQISIGSLAVTLNIEIGHDAAGAPTVKIPSAPTVISDLKVSINSPMSWLYDAIFGIISNSLVKTMEQNAESAIIAGADAVGQYLTGWFSACYGVAGNVLYDGRILSNGFEVGNGYIWMGISYLTAVTPDDECNCEYFEDSVLQEEALPEIVTQHMWQSFVSKHAITQLLENYRRDGLFSVTADATAAPDHTDLLTGQFWIGLFPDLQASVGPDEPLVLTVSVTEQPDFSIYPATCLVDMLAHASLQRSADKAEVLNMDFYMSFMLDPDSNDPRAIRLIFHSECDDVQVTRSSLEPADEGALSRSMLEVVEDLVHPTYSDVFAAPSFYIVSITQPYPEAQYVDAHWAFGSDHGGYIMWVSDIEWVIE